MSCRYSLVAFAAVLVSLLQVPGCGSDETTNATTSDAASDGAGLDALTNDAVLEPDAPLVEWTLSAACEALTESACDRVDDCCDSELTTADCQAGGVAACQSNAGVTQAQLDAGTAMVSTEALTACTALGTEAGAACARPDAQQSALVCRPVFQATAAIGEACPESLAGLMCADGAGVCFPEPNGTTCKLYATTGQACAEAPCAPDQHCIDGVCDRPREAGAACIADVHCGVGLRCEASACAARLDTGAACGNSSDCLEALHCSPLPETCEARLGADETCWLGSACGDGLACAGAGVGRVCWPDGEPQGPPAPCNNEACPAGFTCGDGPVAGTCAASLCAP